MTTQTDSDSRKIFLPQRVANLGWTWDTIECRFQLKRTGKENQAHTAFEVELPAHWSFDESDPMQPKLTDPCGKVVLKVIIRSHPGGAIEAIA